MIIQRYPDAAPKFSAEETGFDKFANILRRIRRQNLFLKPAHVRRKDEIECIISIEASEFSASVQHGSQSNHEGSLPGTVEMDAMTPDDFLPAEILHDFDEEPLHSNVLLQHHNPATVNVSGLSIPAVLSASSTSERMVHSDTPEVDGKLMENGEDHFSEFKRNISSQLLKQSSLVSEYEFRSSRQSELTSSSVDDCNDFQEGLASTANRVSDTDTLGSFLDDKTKGVVGSIINFQNQISVEIREVKEKLKQMAASKGGRRKF
jgi:hypothetical protein